MGISSIRFVKLVIAIEEEFGIELDEEILDVSKPKKLKDLAEYVNSKLSLKI